MELHNLITRIINSPKIFLLRKKRYLCGKHVYPCEAEALNKKLCGENNIIKIDDYLLKHDCDFLKKQNNFRDIIDNKCLNPYKEYQFNKYFVTNETYKELDIIFKFKNEPVIKSNIMLVGEKGSGKTALQNCWLYRNNNLLEESNIFWVRCDCHKLYNLWLDNESVFDNDYASNANNETETNTDRLVNLAQYIDIQLLYVFAKYLLSEERTLFRTIIKRLKTENPIFNMPVTKHLHNTQKTNLYDRLSLLNEIITKEESSQESSWSYAYDRVMRISLETNQIDKNKWLYTSKALQNFFHRNGICILRIVDGADNVHINNSRAKKFYWQMLHQLYKFVREKPADNYINFVAIRERTYIELLESNPVIERSNQESFKRHDVLHQTANIQDVLTNRYNFLRNDFFSDGDIYGRIWAAVITKLQPLNINNIHHNNIRIFLYNKCSLISLVYYRIKQLGHDSAETINTQVDNLSRRNEFLNGRLFLNTRKQWHELNIERGVCCINIFYFNLEEYLCDDENNWLGLCKTRILQLLLKYHNLSKPDIESFLHKAFEYPVKLIDNNLNDLSAFGYIDTKLINEEKRITISEKGRYELNITYSDIDTIYYFALDTPIPLTMIHNSFFEAHNNKFDGRTHYPVSSIITSITFILFLINQNAVERKKYKKHLKNTAYQNEGIKLDEISLPFHDKNIYDNLSLEFIRRIKNVATDGDEKKLRDYIYSICAIININLSEAGVQHPV